MTTCTLIAYSLEMLDSYKPRYALPGPKVSLSLPKSPTFLQRKIAEALNCSKFAGGCSVWCQVFKLS